MWINAYSSPSTICTSSASSQKRALQRSRFTRSAKQGWFKINLSLNQVNRVSEWLTYDRASLVRMSLKSRQLDNPLSTCLIVRWQNLGARILTLAQSKTPKTRLISNKSELRNQTVLYDPQRRLTRVHKVTNSRRYKKNKTGHRLNHQQRQRYH